MDCVELLRKHVNSTLACRGVQLLQILLHKSSSAQEGISASSYTPVSSDLNLLDPYPENVASMLGIVHNAKLGGEVTLEPQNLSNIGAADDLGIPNTDYNGMNSILTELFPSQVGFSNTYLFEELLSVSVGR
jgi:hypothetical protein